MARRDDSLLDILVTARWWVSVVVSGAVYLTLKYIVPAMNVGVGDDFGTAFLKGLADAAPKLAAAIALILLLPGILSVLNSWLKRKRLDKKGK